MEARLETRESIDLQVRHRTAELVLAKEKAESANKAKDAALARMSHDLRTPLVAVLGFSELIKCDTNLSSQQRRAIHLIEQSGRYLLTLIDDILDMARVEAGRIDLVCEPVDIAALAQHSTDIVRVAAQEKGLHVTCLVEEDLSITVLADAKRLRQVLLNLLSNAVKCTDVGAVVLCVSGRQLPGRRACLQFSVTDSGVGIAPENIEKIFLPFEQVGESRRRVGGHGLGLSIVQCIVRLMGGEVRVESSVGSGSRFSFDIELPLAERE